MEIYYVVIYFLDINKYTNYYQNRLKLGRCH